jgi:hypothetical protein
MGLVSRMAQASPGPNPRTTSWLRYPFFAARTESGETMTVEDALTLDVVWSAVRLRAWGVGQLRLLNYHRLGGEERRSERNTPSAGAAQAEPRAHLDQLLVARLDAPEHLGQRLHRQDVRAAPPERRQGALAVAPEVRAAGAR